MGAKIFSLGAKIFSLGAKIFSLGAKIFSLGAKIFSSGCENSQSGLHYYCVWANKFIPLLRNWAQSQPVLSSKIWALNNIILAVKKVWAQLIFMPR